MVAYLDRIVAAVEQIVQGTWSIIANIIPPSQVYDDSVTLPGVLPDQVVKRGAVVKADENNVANVLVGTFPLAPGESLPIEIDNLNKILVTGTAGDIVYYYGS